MPHFFWYGIGFSYCLAFAIALTRAYYLAPVIVTLQSDNLASAGCVSSQNHVAIVTSAAISDPRNLEQTHHHSDVMCC